MTDEEPDVFEPLTKQIVLKKAEKADISILQVRLPNDLGFAIHGEATDYSVVPIWSYNRMRFDRRNDPISNEEIDRIGRSDLKLNCKTISKVYQTIVDGTFNPLLYQSLTVRCANTDPILKQELTAIIDNLVHLDSVTLDAQNDLNWYTSISHSPVQNLIIRDFSQTTLPSLGPIVSLSSFELTYNFKLQDIQTFDIRRYVNLSLINLTCNPRLRNIQSMVKQLKSITHRLTLVVDDTLDGKSKDDLNAINNPNITILWGDANLCYQL